MHRCLNCDIFTVFISLFIWTLSLYSYQSLHDFYIPDSIPTEPAACQLLEKAGVKGWKCGRTKVFLKFYNLQKLEECSRDVSRKVVIVQKCKNINRYA